MACEVVSHCGLLRLFSAWRRLSVLRATSLVSTGLKEDKVRCWRSFDRGALAAGRRSYPVPTVSVSGSGVVPPRMPWFYHYVRPPSDGKVPIVIVWPAIYEHDWVPVPRNRGQWISRQCSRRRKGSRYPTKVSSFWWRRQGRRDWQMRVLRPRITMLLFPHERCQEILFCSCQFSQEDPNF